MNKKIITNKNKQKSIQEIQDEIFRKMPVDKKLSLLNEFFKFGKEMQSLNSRKLEQMKK